MYVCEMEREKPADQLPLGDVRQQCPLVPPLDMSIWGLKGDFAAGVRTHPQGFEGLCIRQELEERGGREQQEGPVDGVSTLQTRQGELVEAVARLVPHRRLQTSHTSLKV